MKSHYHYFRVGYSDGFTMIRFSNVDIQSRSSQYLYKKFYKNFRIDLYLHSNEIELKHASTLHRSRQCVLNTSDLNMNNFYTIITWNRFKTTLGLFVNDSFVSKEASPTVFETLIDDKGAITNLNTQVGRGYRMIVHGKNFLEDRILDGPDALTNWKEHLNTIGLLLHDSLKCSQITRFKIYKTCIFYLVKGFEIYLKKRFIESGYYLNSNYNRLVSFYKKKDKLKIKKEMIESLSSRYNKIIPYLFSIYPRAISFQDYKNASAIYRKVFGINFSQVPLIDNKTIEEIKIAIELRHLHTHSDNFPMFKKLPSSKVLLSNEYILELIKRFNSFINNLHKHITTLIEENFVIMR